MDTTKLNLIASNIKDSLLKRSESARNIASILRLLPLKSFSIDGSRSEGSAEEQVAVVLIEADGLVVRNNKADSILLELSFEDITEVGIELDNIWFTKNDGTEIFFYVDGVLLEGVAKQLEFTKSLFYWSADSLTSELNNLITFLKGNPNFTFKADNRGPHLTLDNIGIAPYRITLNSKTTSHVIKFGFIQSVSILEDKDTTELVICTAEQRTVIQFENNGSVESVAKGANKSSIELSSSNSFGS
jgi:hypothetical protein